MTIWKLQSRLISHGLLVTPGKVDESIRRSKVQRDLLTVSEISFSRVAPGCADDARRQSPNNLAVNVTLFLTTQTTQNPPLTGLVLASGGFILRHFRIQAVQLH